MSMIIWESTFISQTTRPMRATAINGVVLALASLVLIGCTDVKSTWQQKHGWKAEDYFDDAQVIALCNAIEKNDLAEIDRLVAAGANVNAKGKGNMTPLLWAFFDNKLERFTRLLEHGANPNVVIDSDFKVREWESVGESVTHMACGTEFPGYFEAVFDHGGDPDLPRTKGVVFNETPLFTVITGSASDKKGKVKSLIKKGANVNHTSRTGITPAMLAAGWGGRYDVAMMLLEAGADPKSYQHNQAQKLTHVIVRDDPQVAKYSPQQKADYQALVRWLEEHGESLDAARADIKRWDSWSGDEFSQKMDAEIAERKRREAREAKEKKPAADIDKVDK
jgi:ankyrin repeat protein